MVIALVALIALCIVLAVILSYYYSSEPFATSDNRIVYTTNKLNHAGWLQRTTQTTQAVWETLIAQESQSRFVSSVPIALKHGINESSIDISNSPKGHFVRVTLPEIASRETCAFDFTGRRIGYLTEDDKYLIHAIMAAYRIPTSKVSLVNISLEKWFDLRRLFKDGVVDVLITYVVANSPFNILLQSQTILIDGFGGISPERMRLFYPWGKLVPMPNDMKLPGSKNVVGQTEVIEMRMGLYGSTWENFSDVKRFEQDSKSMDPMYKCYGNMSIESRAHCMSSFNEIGELKRKPTVWDKPCITNEDCPYFTGARGGCNSSSGECEFPIGVKRIGFRMHDSNGVNAPFCYAPNGDCGINGDYAFENDGRTDTILLDT